MRGTNTFLLTAALAGAASSRPTDPPPVPAGTDPAMYAGRFRACDAEGVQGFEDPCRCFCFHWACTHALLGVFAPLDVVCPAQYIIGSRRAGNVFVGAIDACIAENCTAKATPSPVVNVC